VDKVVLFVVLDLGALPLGQNPPGQLTIKVNGEVSPMVLN
jgi:hypothetical protein